MFQQCERRNTAAQAPVNFSAWLCAVINGGSRAEIVVIKAFSHDDASSSYPPSLFLHFIPSGVYLCAL